MSFFSGKNVKDWLCVDVAAIEGDDAAAGQNSLRDIAVRTAIGLIADIACGCERQVFEGGEQVNGERWYLWNVSPNENQSANELIARWIEDIYCRRAGGVVLPLAGKLYNVDSFSVEENPLGNDVYTSLSIGGESVYSTYFERDLYRVQMVDRRGRSVLDTVNAVFIRYAEMLESAQESCEGAAGEKYVYQEGRDWVGDAEQEAADRKRLAANLKKFVESDKAVYPLMRDQSLTKVSGGSGSGGSEYADLREDLYSIVAEVFHLPASLLDGNMNNTAEVVNQALTFAVGPLCNTLSREITRKTFTRDEVKAGNFVRFDTSKVRVRDVASEADSLEKLISSGVMCVDEVRELCNLPPTGEEWGRKHYLTKNYSEIAGTHDLGELGGGETL